ncbi:hypothetical protein A7C99_5722 [Trichophyton rubrum]|uniref:Uncharacterized protein n=1 Tax=Trichophyton rubrum TaxID=5551 RepID=A0A178ETL9_TRIRU|nr:hypothetical protein A7C99_5722 [Trichophyton rubrum]
MHLIAMSTRIARLSFYVRAVKKFLDLGVGVNWKASPRGPTALQSAALGGHIEVARHLLGIKGVKLRYVNDLGSVLGHAIHGGNASMAADTGNPDIMKLLLADERVDPNLRVGIRRTALHIAVRKGRHAVQKLLVEHSGVDPDLKAAARAPGNLYDNVELLLDAGADVRAVDREGRTALALAAQYNNLETVDLLLRHGGIDPNICDYAGLTPLLSLLSATTGGNPWMGLSRINVYPSYSDDSRKYRAGATPLMVAIKNTSIVKWLLSMKTVDVDAENDPGMTPLKWASEAKDQSIVELLLEKMDIDTLAVCYTQ